MHTCTVNEWYSSKPTSKVIGLAGGSNDLYTSPSPTTLLTHDSGSPATFDYWLPLGYRHFGLSHKCYTCNKVWPLSKVTNNSWIQIWINKFLLKLVGLIIRELHTKLEVSLILSLGDKGSLWFSHKPQC